MPISKTASWGNHLHQIIQAISNDYSELVNSNKLLKRFFTRKGPGIKYTNKIVCLLLFFALYISPTFADSPTSTEIQSRDDKQFTNKVCVRQYGLPVKIKAERRHANLLLSEVDWQDTEDPDYRFVRFFNSANIDINVGLGPGWQSNFHRQILEKTTERIVILDADGKALIFELNREGSHWQSPLRGQISRNRNYLDWFDTDGSIYTFKGPYLVSLSTPSGLKVDLHYHNEKLVRLSDEKNRIVTLNYTNHGNDLPTNIPKSSTDTRRKSNTASDLSLIHI